MLAKLRPRSVYDVLAAIGCFVALSTGGAYASHLVVDSSDVVDNSLTGTDVRGKARSGSTAAVNGSLTTDDIAGQQAHAGSGTPFIDGTLTQWDVKNSSLVGGDLANNTIGGGKVTDNSITGADVDESSLAQVPSARLGGFGRGSELTSCDPESGATLELCAVTPEYLEVPQGARALVFGEVTAYTEAGASVGRGTCQLSTSTIGPLWQTTQAPSVSAGERENTTLVGVTPPLPAAATLFGISCNDASPSGGGIEYLVSVGAVVISGN